MKKKSFYGAQGETPVQPQAPLIGAEDVGWESAGEWDPFVDWTAVFPGNRGIGRNEKYGLFDAPVGVRMSVEVGNMSDPLIVSERPWEGFNQLIPIAYWREEGKHHLLYTLFDRNLKVDRSARGLGAVRSCTCYAVSEDAYTWERPDMGLVEFQGSKENNIIPETFFGTPFHNPTASRDERFLAMSQDGESYDPETDEALDSIEAGRRLTAMETEGSGYTGPRVASRHWVVGFSSADGIHWKKRAGRIGDMPSDGGTAVQYDPATNTYFAYIRVGGMGRRAIGLMRTSNFWHWPEPPELVLAPDPQDDPEISFYGTNYFRYPGRPDLHGFFLHIYHQRTDHMDNQVAFSRDWIHWQRPERKAVVPVGPSGNGTQGIVRVGLTGLQQLPDGLWGTLYEGRDQLHNDHEMQQPGQIRWARWQPNRFCGVEAEQEGRFTIPTATRTRDTLRLNYRCSLGGWIEVELIANVPSRLNPEAPVLPGYSFAESDRLTGDNQEGIVRWRGNPDLAAAGDSIAIRLRMFQAKIFAYSV